MKLLSERLEERATFEDERVLKDAKAMGFVPEVYSGSQTGALLREAAAALRAVEGAVQADLIGECHDGNNYHLMCDTWQEDMRIERLFGQRVALVPLDAAGSAEGVEGE